jgi:hypothetical protein
MKPGPSTARNNSIRPCHRFNMRSSKMNLGWFQGQQESAIRAHGPHATIPEPGDSDEASLVQF